jgi:phytoene dehydrogenase-like protein
VAAVAPAVLARLLGAPATEPPPEGAQVKVNMLLSRLPALHDPEVAPERAFAGTMHVNERATQLEAAYRRAAAGSLPEPVPCDVYCHSLTDSTILGPELRAAGAHTLTVFALHTPARLFRSDPVATLAAARAAVLRSLDSVLAEPIAECVLDPGCIEAVGPLEIESRLGMPGGHIFHRDLQWPFAERAEDVGRWGVETRHPNVFLAGAGARRGGGVSAIPGRNAALAALGRTAP